MNDLFAAPAMEKSAVISDDGLYRYELWRRWSDGPFCMFIGLNPSTADATKDDPTIRKCIGFAKLWGMSALCMTNLFAWRETDPKKMMRQANPVGPNNQDHLLRNAVRAKTVVAAWGKDGKHLGQDLTVRRWLQGVGWMGTIGVRLHCLRKNGDGSPGHPLYIPYSQPLSEWKP